MLVLHALRDNSSSSFILSLCVDDKSLSIKAIASKTDKQMLAMAKTEDESVKIYTCKNNNPDIRIIKKRLYIVFPLFFISRISVANLI